MDFTSIRSNIQHPAQSPGMMRAAQFGYLTKGVVYFLMGAFALMAAIGAGGQLGGSGDTVRTLSMAPFGHVLLVIVGVGLAYYAVWRFFEAGLDLRSRGDDTKGIATRVGYAISGVVNGAIGLLAIQMAFGARSSGSSNREWLGMLLSSDAGSMVVVVLGFAMVAFGVQQIHKGWRERFLRDVKIQSMEPKQRRRIIFFGKLGHIARGIVFPIIGGFLVQAAIDRNPGEARGVGGALEALSSQPFGAFLLGIVAFGLACYGIYQMMFARHGRLVR